MALLEIAGTGRPQGDLCARGGGAVRLFVGKRIRLPLVGGAFIGVSGPFHPSKIFHHQSAAAVFWTFFLLGLVGLPLLAGWLSRWGGTALVGLPPHFFRPNSNAPRLISKLRKELVPEVHL